MRWACAIVLLFAPFGCALLRSSARPPDEWSYVSFPASAPAPMHRDRALPVRALAAGCAGPDTVTFALELQCAPAPDSGPAPLLVSNWTRSGYRPDVLRAVMSQAVGRDRFATQATTLARAAPYNGILLDLQLLGPRDVDALVRLVATVADSARSAGISSIGIVVPVADTAGYPGRHLGALTDFLAARLELDPASPGPLTPRDRISGLVGARAAEIGAHRVVLVIPADGYLWTPGEPRKRISFEEAVATARDWGVDLIRDETSATLRARAPGRGEIWVNDATVIDGIVRDARRLGIRKFSLYGLGGEDPGIWTAIAEQAVRR